MTTSSTTNDANIITTIQLQEQPQSPQDGIDFVSLPWNLNVPEYHSYIHITTTTNSWDDSIYCNDVYIQKHIYSYQNDPIQFHPATTSLNYGTTIWEGLKCYRIKDDTTLSSASSSSSSSSSSSIAVYRVDQNYHRMCNGAQQMCLPMPSRTLFFKCIQLAVQHNSHLIPPIGDGMKLYIRPILFGSGQQLGLYPSNEFSFIVYVSPTGNYFKASSSAGLNIHLEYNRSRASRGGLGATKCSGNYAIALKPLMDCKQHGFHDNIFLELDTFTTDNTDTTTRSNHSSSIQNAILQEMSAANIFIVLNTGEIITPSLDRGTILPGITRDSIIQLIHTYKEELYDVMIQSIYDSNVDDTGTNTTTSSRPPPPIEVTISSRDVMVHELQNAVEVFCTGTAAELVPIARIATSPNDTIQLEYNFKHGQTLPGGPITTKLLSMLRDAMVGKRIGNNNNNNTNHDHPWIRNPYDTLEEFAK